MPGCRAGLYCLDPASSRTSGVPFEGFASIGMFRKRCGAFSPSGHGGHEGDGGDGGDDGE